MQRECEADMTTKTDRKTETKRAAIYARVSDKSQDTEDKTSISEQMGEMEAYCKGKGLTIVARYHEVGRGWSKKRPEFQRMLADARKGRFDVIICWKSDRLSRGMYPAAALMEVVEAHRINIEAVMDAIDMKTFGLMAAIGKIELDNFRERSTLGKRGTAKQGRVPTGNLPYGYRIGDDGRPEVVEEQAEVVRRIFDMYLDEGMGAYSIAMRLTDEGIPTHAGKLFWLQSRVHHILGNTTYTGTWIYGRYRHIATEDGMKVYDQPRDTWIEIPVPQIIDDETWERAQARKKQRSRKAKRNTSVLYLLQHLLKCGECGHNFHARCAKTTTNVRNGKKYRYVLPTPSRYYKCNGMQSMRLNCRERPYIRAERLEEPIWSEVKQVLQNPDLIIAGIHTFDVKEDGRLEEEIAQAERDVRSIQMEEDRAIRLFVSGKITEPQLDIQRKFITERLESARAKLDDYRTREASGAEKRQLMETVLSWARNVGQGLDDLTDEQRKEILQMVVEQVVIDRDNNVDITLAIPLDDDPSDSHSPASDSPEAGSVAVASKES
jgi:site-specific DNA recombinase